MIRIVMMLIALLRVRNTGPASHPQGGGSSNFPIYLVLLGCLGERLEGDAQGLGDPAGVTPGRVVAAALDLGDQGLGYIGALGQV